MQNSVKGFTLVEVMIATAITAVGVLAAVSVSTLVTNMVKTSNSQLGAQSLRNAVTTVLSDPILCTQNLGGMAFNTGTAASASGIPIKVTLQDGTVIDGSNPGTLGNFSVSIVGMSFRASTGGAAIPLGGGTPLTDPDDLNPNKVYVGDIYLTLDKSNGPTSNATPAPGTPFIGGNTLNSEFISTVMLTVDTGSGKVNRCYTPDPCKAMGLSNNINVSSVCNVCPIGYVWVGSTTGGFTTGVPACLPTCAANQFLISNGTGSATCFTPLPPVNGVCGKANGNTYATAAAANTAGICAAGTATALVDPGSWSWTCAGLHLGLPSPVCTAKSTTPAINGACGPANLGNYLSIVAATTAGLCTTGTQTPVTDNSPVTYSFSWTCSGVNGGTNIACSATKEVNGVCGLANGNTYALAAAANTAGLCTAGTAAPLVDPGPWAWICPGINGGASPACAAKLTTGPIAGVCGPASGKTYLTAAAVMAAGECSAGNTTLVTQAGSKWIWNCDGIGGAATVPCTATIQVSWPIQFGAGGSSTVHAFQQTIDGAGNIYSMGDINAIFPGGTILGSHGNVDATLAKFSSTGLLLWFVQMGATNNLTSTYGIYTDPAGNSYVTGYVENTIPDLSDLLPMVHQIGNHTNHDGFVAKFDTNGNIVWLDQIGGASDTEIYMPTVDPGGRIVVTGYTASLGFIGPTIPGATLLGTNGLRDMFVATLQPNGNLLSIMQVGTGGATSTKGSDLVADGTNIYVTGWTEGLLPGMTQIGAHGTNDVFMASINESTLAFNWIDQIGIAGAYTGTDSDISVCSNLIYNVDFYLNTCTNGLYPGATLLGTGPNYKTLLLKINHATKDLDWVSQLGGSGGTIARGATSPLFLGGGASVVLPAATQIGIHGAQDSAVVDLNNSGSYVAATQFGVPGATISGGVDHVNSTNTGIVTGGNTDAYLGGTLYGTDGAYDGYIYPLAIAVGVPVAGVCGPANGNSYVNVAAVTAAGLCATGNPTAIAGVGPWKWGCDGINGGASTAANACSAKIKGPASLIHACTVQTLCGGECSGWPAASGFVLATDNGNGNVCCVMSPGYDGNGDGKTLWCENAPFWAAASPSGPAAPLPAGSGCTLSAAGYPAGAGVIMYSNSQTSPLPSEICCGIGLGYSGNGDGKGWYCEATGATTAVVTAAPTQVGAPCNVTALPAYPPGAGITLYTHSAQRICCEMGLAYDGSGDGKGMYCESY